MSSCVKSAGAEGKLTVGVVHPATARTIRLGEGGETTAPDQFKLDSRVLGGLVWKGRPNMLKLGGFGLKGGETSFFQNS
jgi:hypothetical protein